MPVTSFVNARRSRLIAAGLCSLALGQLAACGGMSRREIAERGAGNASASGGMSGGPSGATAGDGGDCPLSVEFDVSFDAQGVAGPPNLCAPCGEPNFTLAFSNSLTMDTIAPNCTTLCDTCEIPTCHSVLRCGSELASAAYRAAWSGRYYETGTCAEQACKASKCAPPGDYWATFCAPLGVGTPMDGYPNACTLGTQESSYCTTYGFTLPANGPVSIVLPLHAL